MIEVMFDQHNSGIHRLASRPHGWSTSGFLDAYSFSAKEALAPALIKMEAVMQRRNLQASILPLNSVVTLQSTTKNDQIYTINPCI